MFYSQTFTEPFSAMYNWGGSIMNAMLLLLLMLRTKAIDHVIVMLMLFMCSVYSIEVSIVVQQQKPWKNKYTWTKKWMERFNTEIECFCISHCCRLLFHNHAKFNPISTIYVGMQCNTACFSPFYRVNVCKHIHWK